jgi:hypothetical protein
MTDLIDDAIEQDVITADYLKKEAIAAANTSNE